MSLHLDTVLVHASHSRYVGSLEFDLYWAAGDLAVSSAVIWSSLSAVVRVAFIVIIIIIIITEIFKVA